jgi:hypothetical protein
VTDPLQSSTDARPAPGRLAMSLPQLWSFVAVVLPMLALVGALGTIDLAYHIRIGDLMLRTHRLVDHDTFTYTVAGRSWLDQQWGAQLLLVGVYRTTGWPGLSAVQMLLGGLTTGFVYLACRVTGAPPRIAAGFTLAGFAVAWTSLTLRPQLLGAVLFAVCLWLVAGRRQHPRRMLLVPVVVAIWANVHGSFFLGPLLLALAAVQDRYDRRSETRRVLVVALAALVATLINPFGPRVWTYAYGIARNPFISKLVSEWQPPTIRHPEDAIFFVSVGAVVYLLARRGRPTPWPTLLWLGVFLLMALTATRNTMWWGLAAAPILAADVGAARSTSRAEPHYSFVNTAIAGCLVMIVLVFYSFSIEGGSFHLPGSRVADAPAALTGRLEQLAEPGDRIFNLQRWGSWFEFAIPDNPVFVDSRIELFPGAVWNDYLAVSNGRAGWDRILDRWKVDVVAVNLDQQGSLVEVMQRDRRWRLAYRDDDGVVLVRSSSTAG